MVVHFAPITRMNAIDKSSSVQDSAGPTSFPVVPAGGWAGANLAPYDSCLAYSRITGS